MISGFRSTFLAVALTLATAFSFTVTHAFVVPDTAEAGVLSSIKGAAKKVGGAVKSTAKGVAKAAKAGASVGKQIGVGVGRGAKTVGKAVAKSPIATPVKVVGKGIVNAGKAVKSGAGRAVKYVRGR